jgi:hypothetical protein
METILNETGFLFTNPSFITGFGNVIDPSGSTLMYNIASSTNEADLRAIASDWAMVGADIENATKTFEKEQDQTDDAE